MIIQIGDINKIFYFQHTIYFEIHLYTSFFFPTLTLNKTYPSRKSCIYFPVIYSFIKNFMYICKISNLQNGDFMIFVFLSLWVILLNIASWIIFLWYNFILYGWTEVHCKYVPDFFLYLSVHRYLVLVYNPGLVNSVAINMGMQLSLVYNSEFFRYIFSSSIDVIW